MKADILREKFLDFFKFKKHKIIEGDSLIPTDDPTVLFTPAGMNQFKKQFLGYVADYTRIATCQRCLRTADLEKVGRTPGHHTFFEMLGNFSFGDYFKQEAIIWAWEFLTQGLKIKEEKLWVSVYKEDEEADKIWKDNIGIPAAKIIKLGDKENFWPSEAKQKGPDGPCGPCSEIFFDQGQDKGCSRPDCSPGCDCARFVEIWNLVFTQFNRRPGGILEPLPKKNIDTGMGLERLAAVMQGAPNNFETDLFQPLIKEITIHCQRPAGPAKELIYALADHIRAIAFAIYDGVLPSNEARGYVVRKLIRKSTLHLRQLGFPKPFLYKLVPVLAQLMQTPYPELFRRKENIAQIILAEEKSFIFTLNSSTKLFREKFQELQDKPDPEKAGIIAFRLYDTYGIPLELTKDWLHKQGIKISQEAFAQELLQQTLRSRVKSTMQGQVFALKHSTLSIVGTKFLGYKVNEIKVKIREIIDCQRNYKKIDRITPGMQAAIILDKTPFYPESGGQVGDTGELSKAKDFFEVSDTKKVGKIILHIGTLKTGDFKRGLKKGDLVFARINLERRLSIARNHTATHLLQAALRKVLGSHVQQQGSLVAPERLRFDFAHFKDIKNEELDRIEEVVNGYIINNYPLNTEEMPLAKARKLGALAFFQEKYTGTVRVVSIGDFSKELCAGTHLDSTGAIGIFKIIQEGSIASGIRRIEATTGSFAYKMIKSEEGVISDFAALLKVPAENALPELQKRLSRIKELEKQLQEHKLDTLKDAIDKDINEKKDLNGVYFIIHIDDNVHSVRKAVDLIKERIKEKAVIVSTTGPNLSMQVFFAIAVTEDLYAKGLDALKLIKEIAPEIGGSGGGRKDFAQAGGKARENYESAINKLKEIVSNLR